MKTALPNSIPVIGFSGLSWSAGPQSGWKAGVLLRFIAKFNDQVQCICLPNLEMDTSLDGA